jgi:hypothetical protein
MLHGVFQIIWKSKCTPRIKFFTWLILVDRLNTKTMLRRRNIGDRQDDNCVLCSTGEEETIEHLFFSCPFESLCWCVLDINWDTSINLSDRIMHARQTSVLVFFTEISMIAACEIWKKIEMTRSSTEPTQV